MYFWYPVKHDLTYAGVELNVHQIEDDEIITETRTRAGRSYIELQQQNQTIEIIKGFLEAITELIMAKTNYFHSPDSSDF